MATLEVRHGTEPGVFVLAGEFDITCQEIFDAWLPIICEGSGPVVLDLRDLRFMDSTGVRGLLAVCVERPVVLRHAQPAIKRLLEIVGLAARPEIKLEN
jgi:anti-anti-sigma factor